jgi:hypothetical protein
MTATIFTLPIFLPPIFLPSPLSSLFVLFGYHQNLTGFFRLAENNQKRRKNMIAPPLLFAVLTLSARGRARSRRDCYLQRTGMTATIFTLPIFLPPIFLPIQDVRLSAYCCR